MVTEPYYGRSRVLLAVDEFVIAADVEEELERHGFHVIAAAVTVEEAMKLASVLDFEVAILDVRLGGRSAVEAVRPIVERGIPFIFISGERSLTLPDWTAAPPLVRKPVDSAIVAQMLRAMVG